MAAKRFLDDSGTGQSRQSEKRMKTTPSFASVIKEVVMINSIANFCSALEPLLRRVVNEEVDRGIRRALVLSRSPSLRIQAMEPSNLQLVFSKQVSLPIFTGSKILDIESNPLQVFLVDTSTNQQHSSPSMVFPNSPIKIELVVLDGDFPGESTSWTSEDFSKKIVKERAGKRPLIAGEVNLTMREEGVVTVGDVEFTDNSSWIRSRRFRIGAKVANGSFQGMRVREAMSETFVVRDHRGELYMKRHPPALSDEVWRLEKIGKDGAFHKKLYEKGIHTVQDFLKLSVVDPIQLKRILGMGMSDKMWATTIKHARTCDMGTKSYIFRAPSSNNVFYINPICQVVKAMVNGQFYSSREINGIVNKGYIDHLVKQAYASWDSLQQVDYEPNISHSTPLLIQGEQLPNRSNQHQTVLPPDRCVTPTSVEHVGSGNWMMNVPSYIGTPLIDSALCHIFADSPSDGGDLSPSRSYIGGV